MVSAWRSALKHILSEDAAAQWQLVKLQNLGFSPDLQETAAGTPDMPDITWRPALQSQHMKQQLEFQLLEVQGEILKQMWKKSCLTNNLNLQRRKVGWHGQIGNWYPVLFPYETSWQQLEAVTFQEKFIFCSIYLRSSPRAAWTFRSSFCKSSLLLWVHNRTPLQAGFVS